MMECCCACHGLVGSSVPSSRPRALSKQVVIYGITSLSLQNLTDLKLELTCKGLPKALYSIPIFTTGPARLYGLSGRAACMQLVQVAKLFLALSPTQNWQLFGHFVNGLEKHTQISICCLQRTIRSTKCSLSFLVVGPLNATIYPSH